MIEIDRGVKVGNRIVFPDFAGKQIKAKVVKTCKHCPYICVEREDGIRGGGCKGGWALEKNWNRIRILNTNPNSDIIIKEN